MLILLSNDDGINAPGIRAMHRALKELGDVIVVAPEQEQSAAGHAITIAHPLRVKEVMDDGRLFGYAVDGTPADCVKIALKAILNRTPDIIVSGINQGANVATNIIYSGTVSAATEGTLLGVPSIAISLNSFLSRDFSTAAKYGASLVETVMKRHLPKGTLLNINVPALPENKVKGVRVCRQSDRVFKVGFDKRHDLRGIDYYWQGGEMDYEEPDQYADIRALEDGFVTITPIHYDLTNHHFLDELKTWW